LVACEGFLLLLAAGGFFRVGFFERLPADLFQEVPGCPRHDGRE
jgi:hypothetical protein